MAHEFPNSIPLVPERKINPVIWTPLPIPRKVNASESHDPPYLPPAMLGNTSNSTKDV